MVNMLTRNEGAMKNFLGGGHMAGEQQGRKDKGRRDKGLSVTVSDSTW